MIKFLKNIIKHIFLRRRFPHSRVYFGPQVTKNSKVGKYCIIYENVSVLNSNIDNFSYVQKNSQINNAKVGKFCSIASNVNIGLAEHPLNFLSTNPCIYDKSQPVLFSFDTAQCDRELVPTTSIDADVWVGQNALIKAGVSVGVGAVIGAGAVVVKDVLPYSIVGGVPAKHLKWRFDKEKRDELLSLKWWEQDIDSITQISNQFSRNKER